MIFTLIIVLIAAVAIFFIYRLSSIRGKIGYSLLVLALLFIILTFRAVVNVNSVNLSNPSGLFSGIKAYFIWLGQITNNIRVLTGNAVKMNWLGNITA